MPIARGITRCAIYTRKSTEHGLDLPLNSLVTQREVCQSYIKCQAHKQWVELPYHYDDGGYSGGTLERPALKRLIGDVEAGRVDVIVIYKIDRLTRSLLDFVRLTDVLNRYGASFVSVTQSFDTSDSMGRLVLNVLLTFAQFERELSADRIRDKRAALMRRGLFAGGMPPFGYLIDPDRRLIPDPERSEVVRDLFLRYPDVRSIRDLVADLQRRGVVTRSFVSARGNLKGGQPVTTAIINRVLSHPIYTGHIVHRGDWIKAEVEPLVSREQWDLVQQIRIERAPKRDPINNFLLGILHDEDGRRMKILINGPGRMNASRYYRSEKGAWAKSSEARTVMVAAVRVEDLAISALISFLTDRIRVKRAILSIGLYSDEIAQLMRKGNIAARRLALMNPYNLRHAFLALVPRAEVTPTHLKMLVSCQELARFLGWDGVGVFMRDPARGPKEADRIYTVRAPAYLITGHRHYPCPVQPRQRAGEPKPYLVSLLTRAAKFRQLMIENRTKSIPELAAENRVGVNLFGRLLRLNYLAPDIITAIYDGVEPAGITQWDLVYGSLPLDWDQQRALLGFGASTDKPSDRRLDRRSRDVPGDREVKAIATLSSCVSR